MFWIVLLFIVLPFVELSLLIEIGSRIGPLNTIGIVVATGILGGYLAKREGLIVWRRFQAKLAMGGLPGDEILDGVIVLASGALLITPGVITDFVGLLGLLPPTRMLIKQQLRKRVKVHTNVGMSSGFAPHRPSESSEGKVDITRIVDRRRDAEASGGKQTAS
jgi:UPF0716 protein FxsA